MLQLIFKWLVYLGVNSVLAAPLARGIVIILIIIFSVLAYLAAKRLILAGVAYSITKTKTKRDDFLLKRKVLDRLASLAPALVVVIMAPMALAGLEQWATIVIKATYIYMLVVGVLIITAFLNALLDIYRTLEASKEVPLGGLIQMLHIAVYFIAGIFIFSILLNKTPLYFFGGLGAFTAVLMLIFKDPILGFAAGIQLSANKMIARDDWIEMPRYNVNGNVLEVGLTTVKIQNGDRSITTVPTYTLISESFKNWRGMQESGGRRIQRAIYIDISSIKFCTEKMLAQFSKIQYISEYIKQKTESVNGYNQEHQVDKSSLVNGRHLTNIGTFRAYLEAYLKNNAMINQKMPLLVRQLAPTEHGLPIEILAFSKDKNLVNYEIIQADIFDHILAAVPEFHLRTFQEPTGRDFRQLLH